MALNKASRPVITITGHKGYSYYSTASCGTIYLNGTTVLAVSFIDDSINTACKNFILRDICGVLAENMPTETAHELLEGSSCEEGDDNPSTEEEMIGNAPASSYFSDK